MKPEDAVTELTGQLAGQAAFLWGEQRAADLQESLRQTAMMLLQLGQNPPQPDTEPACYPAAE